MKKSNLNLVYHSLTMLLIFACAGLSAQTNVNMAANGVTPNSPFSINPPAVCSFNFYDSGGPGGNYNNGANASATFIPSNSALYRIRVNFSSFALEEGWDAFYIYNSITAGTNKLPGPEGPTNSGFPGSNWQTINPGVITANTGIAAIGTNTDEALTFQILSDNSVNFPGWSAVITQVPKSVCTLIAPNNITANTGAGSQICGLTVTTALPTFSPGGCNTNYTLQYRINGGNPTVVNTVGSTNISAPVGANVITWELVDPCGGSVLSSATQLITIKDNTPPVIACPGDITFNLQSGECFALYTYSVNCSDNCGIMMPGSVAHPIDFNSSNAGIMFDVKNLGFTQMSVTEFGPSLNAGSWTMQVYYTNSASTWQGSENDPTAWTLAGTVNVISTGPSAGTPITGFNIPLSPGQSMGIYLTSTHGAPVNYTGVGSPGTSRKFNDGKLEVSSAPGAGKGYPFGATSVSRAYNAYVKYVAASTTNAVQQSGVSSGGHFPVGTTTNVFICTDAAGNTAACSFKVTVVEYANPVATLTCNDLVQVALGQDCKKTLHADDILEGGPYGCLANYVVEIDKTPPYGNGPWVPANLTSADIGKTYKVKVTNPSNWNYCTGDVMVVDNLEPDIICHDVTIPCSFPTDPAFVQPTTVNIKFAAGNLPVNVVDFQTVTIPINVDVPANAKINDLDLRLKISGDAFYNNLRIDLQSPLGTIVRTWDQIGGCAPSAIFARFDDNGLLSTTCPNLTSDLNVQIPFGSGTLSSFNGQFAKGTWQLKVSDIDGNGDISKVEIAEIYMNISGTWGAGFPNGLTAPHVVQTGQNTYKVLAGWMDACSDVTLTYYDLSVPKDCASGLTSVITRHWSAKDASGNKKDCIQTINLLRPSLDDVVIPPDYNGIAAPEFNCTQSYPTPDWIQGQGLQGYPTLYGLPNACNLNWTYTDQVVPYCIGSYDIIRSWLVVDGCSNVQSKTSKEVIHVRDKIGPIINCPANVTITTDPFACCGTLTLPNVIVQDGCSKVNVIFATISIVDPVTDIITSEIHVGGSLTSFPGNNLSIPDTMGVFGNSPCIPIGNHIVTYTVQDGCGNTSTCAFTLSVRDYSPPAAACDQSTTVGIGTDDIHDCYYADPNGCQFAGVTWVKAKTFDDGSYDNCNEIKFTIRRATPYSNCIKNLNTCEFETATAEGDSIKFYCCEVGTTEMVILRVYQLDPDGSISLYPDGTPIYNECQVEVNLQDKIKPACEPPLNVTVSCENFDPTLWAYGKPKVYDNCCLDTSKVFQGQCGLTASANFSLFDTVCNKGTIVRTFKTFDCHGLSNQCTQRVVVTYSQNYWIHFPDDKIVTVCDGTGVFGEPQFYGKDCELLGVSYEDQVYTVVPDACYKIERTWKIINWCTYNPNQPCIQVPNPNPNPNVTSPLNLPGPIVSPENTQGAWAPTVVKILPTDASPTNYSTFWSANANCYQYKQIIKVLDNQPPLIVCPASPVQFCDITTNNPQLWNETYWWDNGLATHDLCEGPADISIQGTDLCSGANITIRYLLFLDLDGDGTMETVISSSNPPDAGTVRYNNATSQNFTGGTVRNFDERPVPFNQKYHFSLQTTVNGTNVTGAIRWNTLQSPTSFTVPELPYGTHKVKWIVDDGCGNESVCEYQIVIKDCKAPSVVCTNGLSANIMPGGLTVYVSDFLLDAVDNCTPLDKLKFGIRKVGAGAGFPVDANGNPITSISFGCNDLGTQLIEVWAIDQAGNAGYCQTYIIIQDNSHNCPSTNANATVAGLLKTESNDGLEESDVEISGQNPAGPAFNYFDMSNQSGEYKFSDAVPMMSNYTITPTKDDNPLNGVSTYDLVLISKHILGIQPLGSPYKMIAADANMSGSITTYDIVELRKLILGIYTDLPNNSSWRFVDKAFVFPNPQNPFTTAFPENKTVSEIHDSQMDQNFVAIKIGDVNGSALSNSMMAADDRSSSTLLFDVEDRQVKSGEEFTIDFKGSEKVTGYQFTLNYTDLEVVDIQPMGDLKSENFALFPDSRAITTSWYGLSTQTDVPEFKVKFRSVKSGMISSMLTVSSRITKAEAYSQSSDERYDVAFRFNTQNGSSTITGVGFELYQNQPNPFINKTTIGFHLPEASDATLSIFDETGRKIYSQRGAFGKGYNYFTLERGLLNATGVLYYTLETNAGSATKKMIQTK
jgi:subtilisin-like proprotein convertase family protein